MRRGVDLRAVASMVLLCIIWGIQQVAIKGVMDEVSSLLQIAIRSGASAVLIFLLSTCLSRTTADTREFRLAGCVAGALFALEFFFVAQGLRFTSASHMAVFLYTAPIFAAIGLQLFHPDERLSLLQWGGIALAFTGIAVAFLSGGQQRGDVHQMLIGDGMGLLAGFSWGATTVVVRCSALSRAPASVTLFYQLAGGAVLLLPLAWVSGQHHFQPALAGILSLVFQTLVVSFASYLAWFSLMKVYIVSQLGILSFMTPVFGVLAGMLILHEKPLPEFFYGSALILAGVIIVSGMPWFSEYIKKRLRYQV
ncbi:DMT family transporter [Shimwellia pseudoproteus]|uniref:DMT family transporter n=1 Tax=Shimwellia pseudoproteus TaxID=570012 RepID=UPI002FCE3C5C|nr:DMT family transporter [Shimwellia pseudoproteus]